MGRKRRGSQAFNFEQSEETLMQNETIVKLYQNKTFEHPEPREFETILEEGHEHEPTSNARAKRGQAKPSKDGSLVLGLNKSLRKITEYKFWKQDDKERNRKRKLKLQKLWKGRRREKLKVLDCNGEQKLIDLIADRVSSDEEDESCPAKKPLLISVQKPLPDNCVWNAVESSNKKSQFSKASTSSSDIDFGSQCVWTQAGLDNGHDNGHEEHEFTNETDENIPSINGGRHSISPTIETSQISKTNVTAELSSQRDSFSTDLHELKGLIPESELAELLNTDDLLFCNEVKPQPSDTRSVLGSIENLLPKTENNHTESRKSLRRSARIMSITHISGSIYTGGGENDTENKLVTENVNIGKNKKLRVPDTQAQTEDCSNEFEGTGGLKTSSRRRRSYSLEDGVKRYSLDGSGRNSLLTVTGDMEINISLPQSMRRSSCREHLTFSTSFRPTPDTTCDTTKKEEASLEVQEPLKIRLPVPSFQDSDTDDEEVIISGNMRTRQLKNRAKSRKIKK